MTGVLEAGLVLGVCRCRGGKLFLVSVGFLLFVVGFFLLCVRFFLIGAFCVTGCSGLRLAGLCSGAHVAVLDGFQHGFDVQRPLAIDGTLG